MQSLRELRERRGVKQKAVAEHLGITRQTYANYENDTENVSLWFAEKACEFLGYPVSVLFLDEDVSKTNDND